MQCKTLKKEEDEMKKSLLILLLGFSSFAFAQNEQKFLDLKGDYLGEIPPGDTPIVFARGIVSTVDKEHWAPRFSPDGNEVFWWTIETDNDKKWISFHKTMHRTGSRWAAPEKSPFDSASSAPIFSSDGNRLYFGSKKEGDDPYYVEKHGNNWSEPKIVNIISRFPEVRFAYFPSIASNGTLYFMGYLEGQWINIGIYRAELINGDYAKPELLPPSINTLNGVRNWTPYIAPDESYLIFCSTRGLPASDQGDLYISFRQPDGSWTDPVSLGEPINTKEMERFPAVSPDGKYLFFTRDTPGSDEDVYWVSAKIIDRLREKNNTKK